MKKSITAKIEALLSEMHDISPAQGNDSEEFSSKSQVVKVRSRGHKLPIEFIQLLL